MKTRRVKTPLKDLFIVQIEYFKDARGFFIEPWNKRHFKEAGLNLEFVQEGHSRSTRRVLRGLHYQDKTVPMGKLIRCTLGKIFDVAVDIRIKSPTFGKWFGIELEPVKNGKLQQLYVPPGFAHGFATISKFAEVQYKQTGFYSPASEGTIIWNDPDIGIKWPITRPILSKRDENGTPLKEYLKKPAFK